MSDNIFLNKSQLTFFEILDYKKHGILGNDVSAIYGENKYKGKLGVYKDKVNARPIIDINTEVKERLKKSKDLKEPPKQTHQKEFNMFFALNDAIEPVIAQYVQEQLSLPVETNSKIFQHPSIPFMLADPSYFVYIPDEETGELQRALLFCKRVKSIGIDNWIDDLPYHYDMRLRHEMAVVDCTKALVVVLCEDSVHTQIVLRDYQKEADLVVEERSFYNDVINKKSPQVSVFNEASKSDLLAYARRYMSNKKATEVIHDPVFENYSTELKQVLEQKNHYEDEEKRLKGIMSNYSKTDTKIHGTQFTLDWRSKTTKSVDYDILKVKYPKVYAEVVSSSTSQSLYFTQKKQHITEEKAA